MLLDGRGMEEMRRKLVKLWMTRDWDRGDGKGLEREREVALLRLYIGTGMGGV